MLPLTVGEAPVAAEVEPSVVHSSEDSWAASKWFLTEERLVAIPLEMPSAGSAVVELQQEISQRPLVELVLEIL